MSKGSFFNLEPIESESDNQGITPPHLRDLGNLSKSNDNWLDKAIFKYSAIAEKGAIALAEGRIPIPKVPAHEELKALITQKLREAELRGIEAYRTLILDWARQFHPELLVELEAQLKTVREK